MGEKIKQQKGNYSLGSRKLDKRAVNNLSPYNNNPSGFIGNVRNYTPYNPNVANGDVDVINGFQNFTLQDSPLMLSSYGFNNSYSFYINLVVNWASDSNPTVTMQYKDNEEDEWMIWKTVTPQWGSNQLLLQSGSEKMSLGSNIRYYTNIWCGTIYNHKYCRAIIENKASKIVTDAVEIPQLGELEISIDGTTVTISPDSVEMTDYINVTQETEMADEMTKSINGLTNRFQVCYCIYTEDKLPYVYYGKDYNYIWSTSESTTENTMAESTIRDADVAQEMGTNSEHTWEFIYDSVAEEGVRTFTLSDELEEGQHLAVAYVSNSGIFAIGATTEITDGVPPKRQQSMETPESSQTNQVQVY